MTAPEPAGHYEVHHARVLTAPVMVVALDGWVDAGLAASNAVAALTGDNGELLVTFDGDHYLDQRARRPIARIVDGVTSDLQWPRTVAPRSGHDRAGTDLLFLTGPEPDYHWREFVDAVVHLALGYGVRMVVGLGAFPAPAPHTRPIRLAATAPPPSAELVERVGVVQGELEVPAGVLSALELGFGASGIPTVSLWARVPHYVAAMPYPAASAALVEGLAFVAGLALDPSALRAAGDRTRHQVDELIAGNREHQAMLKKLEEAIDASEGNTLGIEELPSGDELAAELERFLRGEDR